MVAQSGQNAETNAKFMCKQAALPVTPEDVG